MAKKKVPAPRRRKVLKLIRGKGKRPMKVSVKLHDRRTHGDWRGKYKHIYHGQAVLK